MEPTKTDPTKKDTAPQLGSTGARIEDSQGVENDIAATCPVCFRCGGVATRTIAHANVRNSKLMAFGACGIHVDAAIAELSGLLSVAAAMRTEGGVNP